MRKYKQRVWKSTIVKTKKHLFRSLDKFSQIHKSIYIEPTSDYTDLTNGYKFTFEEVYENKSQEELREQLEVINQKLKEAVKQKSEEVVIQKLKEEYELLNLKISFQNITLKKIYDSKTYNKEIKDYCLVEETIGNLISINRKVTYKTELKKILDITTTALFEDKTKRETNFLLREDKVIELISISLGVSLKFAASLFSQIRRRIKYKSSGFYSTNDDQTISANIIRPNYLTEYDITLSDINYLKKNKWLFEKYIEDELRRRIKYNVINEYVGEQNSINDEWHKFYIDETVRYKSNTSRRDEVNKIAIELFLEHYKLKFYKVYTQSGGIVHSNIYIRKILQELISRDIDKKHISEFLKLLKNKWRLLNDNIELITKLSKDVDLFFSFEESDREIQLKKLKETLNLIT